MDALLKLSLLPEEAKVKISNEFGSVAKLYIKVYDFEKENYYLHKYKPASYKIRQGEIENTFYEIEDKLEKAGLDGNEIVTSIATDFTEVITKKIVRGADDYLEQLGSTYEEMREWLRRESD